MPSRAALALVALPIALAGCGGRTETSAWCEQFVTAARAFADVYDRVPDGVDANEAFAVDPELRAAAEDAAHKMQKVRQLDPPAAISDDFELVTSELPPWFVGTDQDDGYDEAVAAVVEFVRSECGVDLDRLAALTNPQAA